MGNIFNDDFRDFIRTLNIHNVRYILVGGYSVILHGYSRTTGDMDIWVDKTLDNYQRLRRAFLEFGMPVFDMTEKRFLNDPNVDVFTYGKHTTMPNNVNGGMHRLPTRCPEFRVSVSIS